MNSDRELLEKAAKAAGMVLGAWHEPMQAFLYRSIEPGSGRWNPLTDDGDALRLAVKLRLSVVIRDDDIRVNARLNDDKKREFCGDDPYAATRRAIVRAAAAIGEQP